MINSRNIEKSVSKPLSRKRSHWQMEKDVLPSIMDTEKVLKKTKLIEKPSLLYTPCLSVQPYICDTYSNFSNKISMNCIISEPKYCYSKNDTLQTIAIGNIKTSSSNTVMPLGQLKYSMSEYEKTYLFIWMIVQPLLF